MCSANTPLDMAFYESIVLRCPRVGLMSVKRVHADDNWCVVCMLKAKAEELFPAGIVTTCLCCVDCHSWQGMTKQQLLIPQARQLGQHQSRHWQCTFVDVAVDYHTRQPKRLTDMHQVTCRIITRCCAVASVGDAYNGQAAK